MPILPFLAHQPFDPDAVNNMSLALERVCEALSLRSTDDHATRFVAEKIIEYAQRDVLDPTGLEAMALKEFGVDVKGTPLSTEDFRVETTIDYHKEYHHGASYKLVSFEQPRPYAPAGR